jgi:hypothetical protein
VQAFGPVDLCVGGILAVLFVLLIAGGWRDANEPSAANAALPHAAAMIEQVIVNTIVFLAIMVGIIASLSLRGIVWWEVFGLDQQGAASVLGRAVILLLLALPLIAAALLISQIVLATGGDERSGGRFRDCAGSHPGGVHFPRLYLWRPAPVRGRAGGHFGKRRDFRRHSSARAEFRGPVRPGRLPDIGLRMDGFAAGANHGARSLQLAFNHQCAGGRRGRVKLSREVER